MSERLDTDDGTDARQQRLDALRDLTHARSEQPLSTASAAPAPAAPITPTLGQLVGAGPHRRGAARDFWRRWWALAFVGVVTLAIVAVVVGSILQHSGLALGPLGAKSAPALVSKALSLQTAQGTLSCPSNLVWSPDGKQLAVVAVVGSPPDGCEQYNEVTNIQRSDSPSGNGGVTTTSGPPLDTFAIVIFDAASGHITRTIKLPELTSSVLCAGADPCGINFANLQSAGWSPDGRQVAAFFTYTFFFSDNLHYQYRGVLITAPMTGASAPQTLIAKGRVQTLSNNIIVANTYSPPRFTFDLSTGASTYADIHRGEYPMTAAFAAGYRLGTDGALTLDQHAQPGDVSPWRAGVLIPNGPQGAPPAISYQTSQWLWSANSRYVLPNLNTGAYMTIAGATSAPPANDLGFIAEAQMTPPDAATTQAVKTSARAASVAALARNPTGALLAAFDCAPNSTSLLAIRSVATGKTLAQASYTYPLTSTSLGCAGNLGPIAWSPDGARIATTDGPDGQIIVWRVNIHA